ncbi:MAG: hypothetical protein JNL70_16560 [Saprospiraceae bacterium]|nr:hypothetical protein [Saprospiraceae bacterium]
MNKYLVLFVPLLLILAHCRKPDKTTYIKTSGKVLEFGSNKPIKNAKVGIYEEGGEFLGSTWTKLVDTTRTDANGFYHFDKGDLDKGSSFFISAAADKYYTYDPNNYLITGQEVTNLNIVLDPFAWIKVHVKNVNPFDDRDSLILGNVVGHIPNILVGKNIELNYINKVFGNRDMRAGWSFSKNNNWIFKADTLNIPAHDTLNYEILY